MSRAVAGVVLAAGTSSRYQSGGGRARSKLLEPFEGEPLVRHPIRAALEAGLDPVLVVTGHAAAEVTAALEGLPVRFAHNAGFAAGLSSSLATGLDALPDDAEAAVVLLGDMPLVRAGTIDALLRGALADPEAVAAVPIAAGRRGNPVLLRRALFPAAADLGGDEGARRLLRAPGVRVTEVAVPGLAVLFDLDQPRPPRVHPGEDGADAP